LVPDELIRREGSMQFRIKKEVGGVEPKKQHSWHSGWAIICVGYLALYKDEPVKLKKRKKVVIPVHVVDLDGVSIRKEVKDGNRKNIFIIESRSGSVTLFQPALESEVNEWVSAVSECSKENSSAAEYDYGIHYVIYYSH
jgi:hypothetical protein